MTKKLFTLLTALVLSIGIGWAYNIANNATISYVQLQKNGNNNFNILVVGVNPFSGGYTGVFQIKSPTCNFGSNTSINGKKTFSSSYNNCTSTSNFLINSFSDASSAIYIENPRGTITFTWKRMGNDGWPIYDVTINSTGIYPAYDCKTLLDFNMTTMELPVRAYENDLSTPITLTDWYELSAQTSNGSTNEGSIQYSTTSGTSGFSSASSSVSQTVSSSTNIWLKANPVTGYGFKGWSTDGGQSFVSTSATYQVPKSTASYTAYFKQLAQSTITATAPNGSISGKVNGSTTFVSGSAYYEESTITLTAQQKVGDYIFRRWEEGGSSLSTDLTYNFTVGTTDRNIVAVYEPIQSYTVTINNAADGTVSGASSGSFQELTQLTLIATPTTAGYALKEWNVTINGVQQTMKGNPLHLTVTGETTVTPVFVSQIQIVTDYGYVIKNSNIIVRGITDEYEVSLKTSATDITTTGAQTFTTDANNSYVMDRKTGTKVSLTDATINIVNNNGTYTLTAEANSSSYAITIAYAQPGSASSDASSSFNYNFTSSPTISTSGTTRTLNISQGSNTNKRALKVDFYVANGTASNVIPTGTYTIDGTTSAGHVKQSSGRSGSRNNYTYNTSNAQSGSNTYYYFRRGIVEVLNISNDNTPDYIRVDATNSSGLPITATYGTKPALRTVTLTTSYDHGTAAIQSSTAAAVDGQYYNGTVLTLSATPESGYRLKGWSINGGAVQTLTNNQLTIDGDKTIAAVFELIPYYTISTSATNGTITGVLTGTQTAFVSGTEYADGTSITLTAIPADGYGFSKWQDNSSTSATRTITVNGKAATYTAIFAKVYTITANRNDETLGTVTGAGDKLEGSSCTLTATPATNCQFVAWKDANGTTVGTNKSYTFTVSASATYTAYFKKVTALNLGSIDLVDNTGSVNTKYIQIEGTSGNYQASIRINTSAIAGTYANTAFNLAKSSLKKSGAAVTLTSASGKVTLSNGTYSISLTLIENEKSEYTVTATYTPCVGEPAGTPLPEAAWGSFTNDVVTMNELSVKEFYHGASSTFAHLHVKNSSNQYVQLNFWVDANHRHAYTNGVGPQPGTYPFATTSFRVERSYGYWYIDKNKQNSYAAGYFYETDYGYGIAPMSSVATTTGAAPTSSDQSIQFNSSTLYVEEGLDGKIYIRCVATTGTTQFTIGAPREASHVINAYVEGEGSVSMTGSCPYNNNEVVTLTPIPADGYEFTGWTGADASAINQDNQLTVNGKDYNVIANFVQTVAKHHVTFKNGTTVLQEDDVEEGVNPAYEGETPTKDATEQYVYTFTGWNDGTTSYAKDATLPEVGSDDVIYTATFSESTRQYEVTITAPTNGTIKVKNGNTEVHTGDEVDYNTVLTITATGNEHYHFDSWTNDGAENVIVTGDKTIGAIFAIDQYTITVAASENGSIKVAQGDNVLYNGNEGDSFEVIYGTELTLTATATDAKYQFATWTNDTQEGSEGMEPEAPRRAPQEEGYSFNFMVMTIADADLTTNPLTLTITGELSFGATFEQLPTKTVTINATEHGSIKVSDGTTTVTEAGTYEFREGATLTLTLVPAGGVYDYGEWVNEDYETISEESVREITLSEDVDLYADFMMGEFTLIESGDNANYNNLPEVMVRRVILQRSIAAGRWSTMCLPFDNWLEGTANYGKIHEMTGATVNGGVVDVTFSRVSSFSAGQPYMYYSSTATDNIVFNYVTFNKDAVADNVVRGDLTYYGVLFEPFVIPANQMEYRYIATNKLYYPTKDLTMTFDRGYFLMSKPFEHAPIRMFIDDNMITGAEEQQQDLEAKKYIEDGNLIIERNGVRYDAQGKQQ